MKNISLFSLFMICLSFNVHMIASTEQSSVAQQTSSFWSAPDFVGYMAREAAKASYRCAKSVLWDSEIAKWGRCVGSGAFLGGTLRFALGKLSSDYKESKLSNLGYAGLGGLFGHFCYKSMAKDGLINQLYNRLETAEKNLTEGQKEIKNEIRCTKGELLSAIQEQRDEAKGGHEAIVGMLLGGFENLGNQHEQTRSTVEEVKNSLGKKVDEVGERVSGVSQLVHDEGQQAREFMGNRIDHLESLVSKASELRLKEAELLKRETLINRRYLTLQNKISFLSATAEASGGKFVRNHKQEEGLLSALEDVDEIFEVGLDREDEDELRCEHEEGVSEIFSSKRNKDKNL